MKISNCTQCNKVFRRTFTPLCPDCYQSSVTIFSQVYRFVQEHPQMTLEDIARCCHIPISKLEALFFDGHLGTAAQHILYQCARCGVPMSTAQHRGRFCTACTGKVETEIRLTQPSRAVEVIEGEAVLAPEGTSSEALQKQQREQQKRTAEKIDEAKTILAEEMEQADKAMENDQRKTLAPQHFGFKRSS